MQRKYKLLAIIAICALAASTVAALGPAIASWIDNSIANVTSKTATDTFTTTVTEVSTNATSASPISVSGLGVSYGDPNTPSTVAVTTSGFVPNDYMELQVVIHNTGSATLQFTPTYTWSCYFVKSDGTDYAYPNIYSSHNDIATQKNIVTPMTYLGFNGVVGGGVSDTLTFTDGNDANNLALFGNTMIGASATGNNVNWEVGWGSASTFPTTLASGATFTYSIYIGLGINVPYGIPNMFFSLNIPLTTVQ